MLYRKLAGLFGYQKATSLIRNYIDGVINRFLQNEIEIRNGFYWPKGEQKITVRIPNGTDGVRHINMISSEEIAEAIYVIATKSFGITERDIYIATARAFGFNRTGDNIIGKMDEACKLLLKTGKAISSEGKIIVP